MRLAEIIDGIVVNVLEVTEPRPDWTDGWPEAGHAGPGWTYRGGSFTPPREWIAHDAPDLIRQRDGWRMSALTFHRIMKLYPAAGFAHLRAAFMATVATLVPDDDLRLWVEHAATISRTDHDVAMFRETMGLIEDEIDVIFQAAAILDNGGTTAATQAYITTALMGLTG